MNELTDEKSDGHDRHQRQEADGANGRQSLAASPCACVGADLVAGTSLTRLKGVPSHPLVRDLVLQRRPVFIEHVPSRHGEGLGVSSLY